MPAAQHRRPGPVRPALRRYPVAARRDRGRPRGAAGAARERRVIVLDASVLADALLDDGPVGTAARAALTSDPHWAAPAHLLVEVVSVIRGKTLGGKLGPARANDAIQALSTLVIDPVNLAQLVDQIWQLRS